MNEQGSFDALNWLPAGYIVVWPQVRQASNYCGMLIDGDDLLVAARTSREGRNQHDNDLTTFHRVQESGACPTPSPRTESILPSQNSAFTKWTVRRRTMWSFRV